MNNISNCDEKNALNKKTAKTKMKQCASDAFSVCNDS